MKIKITNPFLVIFSLILTFGLYSQEEDHFNKSKYKQFIGSYFKESNEDFHKRMEWFGNAQRGMFVHFGLYSQLQGHYWDGTEMSGNFTEWIWSRAPRQMENYNSQDYVDLIKVWNPKNFNADKIADLAVELGMKYITIGSKHHEGFCLWPSNYTEFDIENSPMKGRDIMKEMAEACKKRGLKYGIYYSIPDWYFSREQLIKQGKDVTNFGGGFQVSHIDHEGYFTYMKNQLKELIKNYDADLIWFDGSWQKDLMNVKRGYELYEYTRSLKPSIIINERCFSTKFKQIEKKDFYCKEGKNMTPEEIEAQKDPKKRGYYEYCTSTQESWGYDSRKIQATNKHYRHPNSMLAKYFMMRNVKGNYLLNFGPDKNGDLDSLAIKSAKNFAIMAKEADKTEDYSDENLKKLISKYNFEQIKNLNHYFYSDKEKYDRLVKERREKKKKK